MLKSISFDDRTFRQRSRDYFALFRRPRPVSEHLSVDLFFLALVLFCQEILLPMFFGRFGVDFVTTWLIFIFVFASPGRSLFLLMIASAFIEGRSAIPSGLYFSFYILVFAFIWNFRNVVSWRHKVSWIYVFATALLAQHIFILLCASLFSGSSFFTIRDFRSSAISFLLSWSLALLILVKSGWVDLSGDHEVSRGRN